MEPQCNGRASWAAVLDPEYVLSAPADVQRRYEARWDDAVDALRERAGAIEARALRVAFLLRCVRWIDERVRGGQIPRWQAQATMDAWLEDIVEAEEDVLPSVGSGTEMTATPSALPGCRTAQSVSAVDFGAAQTRRNAGPVRFPRAL